MNEFPVALPGAQADTLMWADPEMIEPAALAQLRNISRLPWVHQLRVMPDVHLGKGATIGSVIATDRAIIPAAVGVDIGCGMAAARTSLGAERLDARALVQMAPEVFLRTTTQWGEPKVAFRMRGIDLDHLHELVTEAWRIQAPKYLRAEFDAR